MAIVHAIEKSFAYLRNSASLERAFERWQWTEASLGHLSNVEALIALCRNPNVSLGQRKNEALASLCALATGSDGIIELVEADAGLLLIWLYAGAMRNIAKEIGESPLTLEELDSEMLAGFWDEASNAGRNSSGLSNRLYHAARRSAWKAVTDASRFASRQTDLDFEMPGEINPSNNPSCLLERAKSEGVLSQVQVELIGATRLDGMPLAKIADELGLTREAATMQRTRAHRRLAVWLSSC
ncbi:MAG: hypothetical protein WD627_00840 [Actinomycetota bacterium]